MRWRLIRRRLSISSPRMAVRSDLPWPLRWAVVALMLGFSGALGLWAFEFGRDIAGLRRAPSGSVDTLAQISQQLEEIRHERDGAQSIANAADSLLKAERVTQMRLAEQVKSLEAENQALKDDLGFFERLLPAAGEGLSVRGLQAERSGPGQLRFQLLVMQRGGRTMAEFKGHFELLLSGQIDGRPWNDTAPLVRQPLQFKQYRRVEGVAKIPPQAVIRQVQVRIVDESGILLANQTLKL